MHVSLGHLLSAAALCLQLSAAADDARLASELWSQGTAQYDADRYQAAAQAFGRLTALRPNSAPTLAMLGLCEYRLGNTADALKHLERATNVGLDENAQIRHVAFYHEGLLLLDAGRFEDAQRSLDRLAAERVDSPDLKRALGSAILRYRRSRLPSDRKSLAAIDAAGTAELLAASQQPTASRAYEHLVSSFGVLQNVQYAYGRYLLSRQEQTKAAEAFRRELANTPSHVLARLALANTLRLNDPGASLNYAEEAVRLAPDLPLAHYVVGVCLLDAQQPAKAVEELLQANGKLPGEARIYYALAKAYRQLNKPVEAQRAIQQFRMSQNTKVSAIPE